MNNTDDWTWVDSWSAWFGAHPWVYVVQIAGTIAIFVLGNRRRHTPPPAPVKRCYPDVRSPRIGGQVKPREYR